VSSKVIKKLKDGKYVHIDQLVRQYQSARTDQHLASIGSITLSTTSTKARTVDKPTDWHEAFLSSILPVIIQQALAESTVDGIKSKVIEIERHVSYGLAALTYFNRFSFTSAKNYLESHRDKCYAQTADISEPDIPMFNTMQRLAHSSSSTAPSSNSSSSSSSSSASPQSGTNRNRAHSNRSPSYNAEQCGKFNSYDGCPNKQCPVKHQCRICKSDEHGQTKCPDFKKVYPKKK
jgi:hypothetical protein